MGATTIEVQDDVSAWANIVSGRDTEIIITTTSNKVTDTEKAVIQSVSGTTITLKEPLQYRHISKFFFFFFVFFVFFCILLSIYSNNSRILH